MTLRSEINIVVKRYASVSDMVNDATLIIGQRVAFDSYYAGAGVGGNEGIVVAAATGTHDGGSYIDLTASALQFEASFSSVRPEQFGSKGDGISDDTSTMTSFINYCISNNKPIITDSKKIYKLTSTGTYLNPWSSINSDYSVRIDSVDDLLVDFGGSVIYYDCDDATLINPILFTSCSKIRIKNINGLGYGSQTAPRLHRGQLIAIVGSEDVSVSNVNGLDVRATVLSYRSKSVRVKNGLTSGAVGLRRNAAYAFYNCSRSYIDSCTNYESTYDGDIGLYGVCSDCHIRNCGVYNYQISDSLKTVTNIIGQGIFIDAGCSGCSAVGNTTYGQYYGIDVKTNCQNILVEGNTIFVGKVGIASRRGEANDVTHQTNISNNKIMFVNCTIAAGTFVTTQSGYAVNRVGILFEDSFGSSASNNEFCAYKPETSGTYIADNCAMFYVKSVADLIVDNIDGVKISNNKFRMKSVTGATSGIIKGPLIVAKGAPANTNKMFEVRFNNNEIWPGIYTVTSAINAIEIQKTNFAEVSNNKMFGKWTSLASPQAYFNNCTRVAFNNNLSGGGHLIADFTTSTLVECDNNFVRNSNDLGASIFRDIKQLLHIKTFIGTSENAVKIQIWTALITILILKYLKSRI